MNSKKAILFSVALFSLVSCGNHVVGSSQKSDNVCSEVFVTPENANSVFAGDKDDIYCWKTECGSIRCARWIRNADGKWPELKTFQYFQEGMSTSLNEMAGFIAEREEYSARSYYVFMLPSTMDEEQYLAFKNCPYAYICQEQVVYEGLGLLEQYDKSKKYGLIHESDYYLFNAGSINDRRDILLSDAVFIDQYAIITRGATNYIFTFDGNVVVEHIDIPFVMFDSSAVDKTVGLSLSGLVEKIGAPSFLSNEGETALDYVCSETVYRFSLVKSEGQLIVSSVERMGFWAAFVGKQKDRIFSTELLSRLPSTPSAASLVRILGKPSLKGRTSGVPYYVYRLDDNSYLSAGFLMYPLGFDGSSDMYSPIG